MVLCVVCLTGVCRAADVVTLRNGDRLSGELVQLKDGTLTFKALHAGTVKIPAAQIASLATDGPVTLRFKSGGYSTGRLTTAYAGTMWLSGANGLSGGSVSIQDVAEIHPGTEISRGFRWTGRVNVGASQQSGNTDTKSLHIDAAMTGRSEKDRLRFTGDFNREFDHHTRTEDNFTLFAQHDHFVSKKLYFYTNVKFQRDQLADLRLRTTVGTGGGWQIFEDDETNLSVEAGPAYSNEDQITGDDRDFVAGRWAVNFDQWLWGKWAQLFHKHDGTVDLERTENVFIDSSTGLRFPLGNSFNLTLQADINWDNQPADDASTLDKKYMLTVGYSW